MATIITMPRLSDTMTEGTVATWLKKVGDKVSEGDMLAEIETDKATMEFESFNEGTLLYIGIQAGETAPIDALLAIIGTEGEDISALIAGGATTAPATETTQPVIEVKQETATPAATALPAGVIVVTMPRLSDTMTEGTVATWLKKVGDKGYNPISAARTDRGIDSATIQVLRKLDRNSRTTRDASTAPRTASRRRFSKASRTYCD